MLDNQPAAMIYRSFERQGSNQKENDATHRRESSDPGRQYRDRICHRPRPRSRKAPRVHYRRTIAGEVESGKRSAANKVETAALDVNQETAVRDFFASHSAIDHIFITAGNPAHSPPRSRNRHEHAHGARWTPDSWERSMRSSMARRKCENNGSLVFMSGLHQHHPASGRARRHCVRAPRWRPSPGPLAVDLAPLRDQRDHFRLYRNARSSTDILGERKDTELAAAAARLPAKRIGRVGRSGGRRAFPDEETNMSPESHSWSTAATTWYSEIYFSGFASISTKAIRHGLFERFDQGMVSASLDQDIAGPHLFVADIHQRPDSAQARSRSRWFLSDASSDAARARVVRQRLRPRTARSRQTPCPGWPI